MTATRRTVLAGAAATSAVLAMPGLVRAQAAQIKIGILQPVTGALAQDGEYGRLGAEIALNEINAAGGIKSMGGATLKMVFGDARSNPEGGTAEVERMQSEGVAAIVGEGSHRPSASRHPRRRRATTSPTSVDVGVSDPDRQSGTEEHVPPWPRVRHGDDSRARQPGETQRRRRKAGQDGCHRA